MQQHGPQRLVADAQAILRAAIRAADPGAAVERALGDGEHFREADPVRIIAIGKAAVPMARAALGCCTAPAACCVVSPSYDDATVAGCSHMRAAHPLPDASSLAAAVTVERALRAASTDDIVLMLISGGASSLCTLPVAGVSIADYAITVRTLLAVGADIHALNTVRSHIDRLKGGGMARLAFPARVLALIISDVPGDDPAVIASGPLTRCRTRPADALAVLRRFDIENIADGRIRTALERRAGTGNADDPAFGHVRTRIIARNATALDGAAAAARSLGYDVVREQGIVTGEARHAAAAFVERLVATTPRPDAAICLLAGGETTVTVHGTGSGGRNQEFALAAGIALHQRHEHSAVVGAVGTDGIDGPTDAAGAIADASLVDRARHAGRSAEDALRRNDSHALFAAAGGLLRTGPTRTNVMDVMVGLRAAHS
jgi:glycerate 2-kinase